MSHTDMIHNNLFLFAFVPRESNKKYVCHSLSGVMGKIIKRWGQGYSSQGTQNHYSQYLYCV